MSNDTEPSEEEKAQQALNVNKKVHETLEKIIALVKEAAREIGVDPDKHRKAMFLFGARVANLFWFHHYRFQTQEAMREMTDMASENLKGVKDENIRSSQP